MSLWDLHRRNDERRNEAKVAEAIRAEVATELEQRAKERPRRRPHPRTFARAYAMARNDRFASTWSKGLRTADGEVAYQQQDVLGRARELEQNDPYVGRFLQLLESNVVGERGIKPVPMPRDRRAPTKRVDPGAAKQIREAWEEWTERGTCTVCGQYSFADVQRRVLRSVATDGELFVRIVKGPKAGNRFNFALQLLESEVCDFGYSATGADGTHVRMGVEVDEFRRPIAYHFFTEPPNDFLGGGATGNSRERIRVMASEMIHAVLPSRMRPGQTRGISWLAPVGESIYQLNQYRHAELVGAREAASVQGYYKMPAGEDGWSGDFSDVDEFAYLKEVEPNEKEILPPDWDYINIDHQRPTTAFDPFSSSLIRSIASGMGLSFESVASDLTRASYSSGRIGALEDRQTFRRLQVWLEEILLGPLWGEWLEQTALSRNGPLSLSAVNFDRLLPVRWQARGWAWIDPSKDAAGQKSALENRSRLLADMVSDSSGRTLEEHVEALKAEVELFESAGLTHPSAIAPSAPSATPGSEVQPTVEDD